MFKNLTQSPHKPFGKKTRSPLFHRYTKSYAALPLPNAFTSTYSSHFLATPALPTICKPHPAKSKVVLSIHNFPIPISSNQAMLTHFPKE